MSKVIEIQEEVEITQEGRKIILEKGDRIRVIEGVTTSQVVRQNAPAKLLNIITAMVWDNHSFDEVWQREIERTKYDNSMTGITQNSTPEEDIAFFTQYVRELGNSLRTFNVFFVMEYSQHLVGYVRSEDNYAYFAREVELIDDFPTLESLYDFVKHIIAKL